jgi:hypothetical protein
MKQWMKMMSKQKMFDAIVEICDSLGLEYRSYSGRGMYGEKGNCIGFTTSDYINDLLAFGMAMGKEYPDFDTNTMIDDMGMDMIIYFPHVNWLGEEGDEEV